MPNGYGSPMVQSLSVVEFRSHVHSLSFHSCCAAPFCPSILSQSAPWMGTNSSAGGFYARHNVAELTLCLWLATAAVQHCCHILRPQTGHKNTRKEETDQEKRKQATWLMAAFDLISATPEWMIADYLWLSVRWINNCSFCEDLTGDICFMSFLGESYNILSKKQMFFFTAFMRADVIIFAMFA